MTRFSEDWYAARQKAIAEATRKAVDANCEAVALGMDQDFKIIPVAAPTPRSATVASSYPLVRLCKAHGLPEPLPEYRFHPVRKYRFDYAYPVRLLAIEIEGGIWTQGRHTRGTGALEDMRKYTAAALLGWRIFYYQPSEFSLAINDLRVEFAG